jgi:hypothetical protein
MGLIIVVLLELPAKDSAFLAFEVVAAVFYY